MNLIKSDGNFSPSKIYVDYIVNELLFHWQTQNSVRPDIAKGLPYVKHKEQNKCILIFVRAKAKNGFGKSVGYVFIGESNLKDFHGKKTNTY